MKPKKNPKKNRRRKRAGETRKIRTGRVEMSFIILHPEKNKMELEGA